MSDDKRDPHKTRPARPVALEAPAGEPSVDDPRRRASTVGFEDSLEASLGMRTESEPVDPRAIAVTIDSEGRDLASLTARGTGAEHCPVCGAFAGRVARCAECGYAFEDPRLGQIVAGRYRVDSLLGAGGFGRVYSGTHLTLGEPVAIKFLLEEFSSRPEARARFKREAIALARVRHPAIVAIHDYGEHLGELFMVMELVQGTQLFDSIRSGAGELMSLERACALTDQLLSVLEVAHAVGVVHRDLKPENVMLLSTADREDHIKVLDFGLALMDDRGGERLTATRAVQGTPIYMSPEQCRGRDVGAPTDVYAVGVMLFEMLAGEPPFVAESLPDLMARHMYMEPPTIAERSRGRAVPAGVEAVVRSALAKSPADRPSAREFRERLALALRGGDEVSLAAHDAQRKIEHTALTREQRALVDASVERAEPGPGKTVEVAPSPDGVQPRVFLWGLDAARADSLRGALSVHGVNAVPWKGEAPPDGATLEKRPARAILVGGASPEPLVKAVRAAGPTARLPVLVLDATAPTPALIRAGASDVSPHGASDEAVCKQVVRLIRRGR